MAVIEEKKEIKKTVKKAAVKKAAINAVVAENSDVAYKVLIEPWITEKTHRAIADNKYTFKVTGKATKQQVRMAVEGMYGVHIEKVTTVNNLPKKKAYGRFEGKKAGLRKATVTLKKGEKIELFQAA